MLLDLGHFPFPVEDETIRFGPLDDNPLPPFVIDDDKLKILVCEAGIEILDMGKTNDWSLARTRIRL